MRKYKEPSNSGVLKEKIERVIEEGTFKKSKEEIKKYLRQTHNYPQTSVPLENI